ncbi:MAG: hypothetical protein ACLQVI_38360 [Polyangiaceae bacterium]
MTRSSLVLVLASSAAAALLGACSSDDTSGGLLGRATYVPSGSSSGGQPSGSGSGSGSGGSSSGAASSSGGSSSGGGSTAPPPDAGPGSTSSQAHQFFDATVYPELVTTCAPCHATGVSGAPTMMAPPADNTYSSLDALGLIQTSSLLLTKGSHDNGAAPALTSQESADITTWLGMEAQERTGAAAPANILSEVAQCVSEADWNAIGWGTLTTQPRTDENPDKCSGCAYAQCASCHSSGEQGFFMDMGTAFDPDGSIAFQQTFQGPFMSTYVIQYFGLNGTTPVASNAIMTKQQAVATGPAYSHPMFVMPQTMQTALTTFVNDAITAYTNHTCGGDAGVSEDGGP